MHVTVRELVLLAAQLRACLPFFSGGRYGGRAWLAPPPCAPRRPANRAPRAGRVHVRRVPAMAAWLARRQARRQLHRLRVLGESITIAGSDRPCRPCCQRAFVVLRVWSTPPQTPNRSPGPRRGSLAPRGAPCAGPARCKGGASRAPVSVDLCGLPPDTHRASTPRESIRRRMCPPSS